MKKDILSDPRINAVTQKVVEVAQKTLGDRLEKIILFGSYARGDYDGYSDIDFCILTNIPNEETWKWRNGIREKIPMLDLEYDIIISLHVTNSGLFNRFANDLPYYTNIIRDGVQLYA